MKKINILLSLMLVTILILCGCTTAQNTESKIDKVEITQQTENNTEEQTTLKEKDKTEQNISKLSTNAFDISSVPAYNGKAYVAVNDNKPYFSEGDLTTKSFEKYSPLDSLERCGVAYANIGTDIMPTEDRGSIGMVKPSGW